MRLIDADALSDIIIHFATLEPRDMEIVLNAVHKAPTILSVSAYAAMLEKEMEVTQDETD